MDPDASGFTAGSAGVTLLGSYQNGLPNDLRRPGYPEDVVITFSDVPVSTSRPAIGQPATPAKFRAVGAESGYEYEFFFRDLDGDNTLSAAGEFIDLLTPDGRGLDPAPPDLADRGDRRRRATRRPGDVYRLVVPDAVRGRRRVRVHDDAASGSTRPRRSSSSRTRSPTWSRTRTSPRPRSSPSGSRRPGRGPRRIEFRAIPANATVRIYTVTGDLVQTLRHDGLTTGMVPWDLRSKDNLEVAPGLYIFHVDAPDVGESVGRFAIIK